MWTRRRFLRWSTTAAVSGAVAAWYAWQVEPHWLELTHRDLPIAGLPKALQGRTLAHVSDLHVGPRVQPAYLAATFDLLRGLAPDVVAYTGDFITLRPDLPRPQLPGPYAHLPLGRLATLAVLGNHDYGHRWTNGRVAARVEAILRDGGATVLRNAIADVHGLQVVGLDEFWSGRFDLGTAVSALRDDAPMLTLCHNPDAVDAPGWDRIRGWILAGHTHGGQVKLPFLPPFFLPVVNRRYVAGEVALSGGRRLYISRGVGHSHQVRFGVRPELAMFTLVRA